MTESELLVAGSSKVYNVAFEFSLDWQGLSKTVLFKTDADPETEFVTLKYKLLDESGTCELPPEVIKKPGYIVLCGVCGMSGTDVILPTTWISLGEVKDGADPGQDPPVPTPDVYQQIITQIGDLSSLTTEEKSSLVAAVNELNDKIAGGSGLVRSDDVEEIIVLDLEEYEAIPEEERGAKTLYAIRG